MSQFIKSHLGILQFLVRMIVADRFKRMAKDEALFKFLSAKVDPVFLVDQGLQAEREALDLAEMSLLTLVDSKRLDEQLESSSVRIQARLCQIYGSDFQSVFANEDVLSFRKNWIRERVNFYRHLLSLTERADSPSELTKKAFRSHAAYREAVDRMLKTERDLSDATIKKVAPLHRFLMTKQLEYEMKSLKEVMTDFGDAAFKEPSLLES